MKEMPSTGDAHIEGARLLAVFSGLANPHRMRIVAALDAAGPTHVSQLARDVGMSRPLLYMHLQKLEAADLVTSRLVLSADGKSRKLVALTRWKYTLTPAIVAEAAQALPQPDREDE